MNRIYFTSKDRRIPKLDLVAEEIALFLITNRTKIADFSEMMRQNWNLKAYKNELARWAQSKLGKRKRNAAPDTERLIELCYKFYTVCQDDEELKKMRGLVPEKIVESMFKLRYKERIHTMGFGANVTINKEEVKYKCKSPYKRIDDSDEDRQTVDVGVWDWTGNKGEFVEIKFRPDAFHTKDVKYLRLLSSCLNSYEIKYLIFLVSLDDKSLTEQQLKSLDLWDPDEFTLIGREELFNLQMPSYVA